MADLYNFKDYRDYMVEKTNELHETKGLISKMAEAANCQRSHISRVLNSHLHLTLEQAHGLTVFWKLSENETTFFLRLVEHARAGSLDYRRKLEREIAKMKQEHENLSKRLNLPSIGIKEAELLYYSSWYWSAIHIATSISSLQTSEALAERMQLPEMLVIECLKKLEHYGLVARSGTRWVFSSNTIHLPKESPMNSVQHGNWRTRAVLSSQLPGDNGVHYTTVQSLSASDYQKLQQMFLQTIDSYHKVAAPSKEEELVCFALDFFKV